MVGSSNHKALSPPPPSRQSPPRPPFTFSHPIVYVDRVQSSVQAIEDFVRDEVFPKVMRLQEEHECIEQQILQRTLTSAVSKQHASKQKMKQQAWAWKRTSKKQELNRWEGFLDISMDLQRLVREIHPDILFLTILWQRSQSIPPCQYVEADDSTDVVYDSNFVDSSKKEGRRRHTERQRLSLEYSRACMENIRLSKSIRERLDRMEERISAPSSTASSSFSSAVGESTTSREDASFWSSLELLTNNFCVCGTCQGMIHKDYFESLIVRYGDDADASTFICIHCWNTQAREQRQEQHRLAIVRKQTVLDKSTPDPRQNSTSKDTKTHTSHFLSETAVDKDNEREIQTQPSAKSHTKKSPLFETARWKARKKVLQDRMTAASTKNTDGNVAKVPVPEPKNYNHSLGSPLSSSSITNREKMAQGTASVALATSDRIASVRFKMNSSAVLDNNQYTSGGAGTLEKRGTTWSRYGSTASSICSNSIAESLSIQSAPKRASHRRTLSEDSSLYSTIEESFDSSLNEIIGERRIKSAMKKTSAPSNEKVSSPSKIQDFPSMALNKKRNVRFKYPLEEHKTLVNESMASAALLDTSAEIWDTAEYFCNCHTLYDAFENQAF